MLCRISSIQTTSYDPQELDRAIEHHFASFADLSIDWPGSKILIKPNLLMKRSPDEATTTHPEFAVAVVRKLKSLGALDITIADSPGGPFNKQLLESVYKATGMSETARITGAKLNTDVGWQTIANRATNGCCPSFNLINPIADADVIINLPKLKTHAMTTLSGGVKNLLGCVPGLQKPEMHFRFPEKRQFGQMLVEIAQTVKPQLTIIDAVVAMEGNGPSSGSPKFVGWTFASDNAESLDLALCHLIGVPPAEVCTVAYSLKKGSVPLSLDDIEFIGTKPEPIADFKRPDSHVSLDNFTKSLPDFLQVPARKLVVKLFTPKPRIKKRWCIGCQKCAESCPQKVIYMVRRKARIKYEGCIKCFCCHEMCPVRAIDIKRIKL